MKTSKLLAIYMSMMVFLLVVSASIALPILFRPFYYWQINLLNIPAYSGYSVEVIKQAYNEMLDFCIGLSSSFSCGQLAFSSEGAAHFVDCKGLFMLDFFIISFAIISLIICGLLRKKIKPAKIAGHSYLFNGALITLLLFLLIVLLALPSFDAAFVAFHKLFFPGKDNWLFDPRYDQIINILPETFFMNCGILIVSVLIISCLLIIIKELKKGN